MQPTGQPYGPSYSPPPPPPPPRNDSGCWKWGAIGCGSGCLLLVILIAVIGYSGRGLWKQAINMGMETAQAQQEMKTLWTHVDRYHKDKGKYPDKLEDLVPNYVASEKNLHLSVHPEGPQFGYIKPGPNSAPDDVMLTYEMTIQIQDTTTTMQLQWTKNGQYKQSQSNTVRHRGNSSP